MKKTISVNIKGLNFLVEEDAYELLQNYLERLEQALGGQTGAKEILEDIEIRIAELCNAKLNDTKTVIELIDIETILENLGDPSEYLNEEDNDSDESENYYQDQTSANHEKRLYRDDENGAIAGVCAGIANYFNLDVVIIRIIFVIILLFGGFGFPLYIILWIVIPKAKNTIDRLRMKGRPVTVENVKQEVENAAEKIKDGSKRLARRIKRDEYGQRVSKGVRVITSLIGIGLIGFGLIHLIGFLIVVIGGFQFFPIQSEEGFISINEAAGLFLAEGSDISWAWAGGLMVALSIIMFFFLLGSILLFRIRNTWAKLSLLGLFLTGIAGGLIGLSIGLSTGKDMAMPGEVYNEVGTINSSELTIIPILENMGNDYIVKSNGRFGLAELKDDKLICHGIDIEYVQSSDSLFHITQFLSSQGKSHEDAKLKSSNINHSINIVSDSLKIEPSYRFDIKDKWRFQEVTIVIEVPIGGSVKVDNQIVYNQNEEDDDNSKEYYRQRGHIYGNGNYHHRDYYRSHHHSGSSYHSIPDKIEEKIEDLEKEIEDLEEELEEKFDDK